MAPSTKAQTTTEPTSPIVVVQYVDEKGTPTGLPHKASRSATWVVDGLADGTLIELQEEEVVASGANVEQHSQPGQPAGPTAGSGTD